MKEQTVTVTNPTGLHLRTAGILCEEAMRFRSHVTFTYRDGREANAKSLLSILGACVKSGDTIHLICEGEDEEDALASLSELIRSGFQDALP